MNNIIDIIRSSLDIQETLRNICIETGKLFNVQRAVIVQLLKNEDTYSVLHREEFVFSDNVLGINAINNANPEYIRAIYEYFDSSFLENTAPVIIPNLQKSDLPDLVKKGYEFAGVKSILAAPIMKANKKWGWIILDEYNKYRKWTKKEVQLIEEIASQAYIAIYQSELYETQKKYAELFDTASDAIMLIDKKGHYFDCNQMTLELFGCPSKEEFCRKCAIEVSPDIQADGTDSITAIKKKAGMAFERGYNRFDWIHKRLDNNKEFPAEVILKVIEVGGKKVLQATVRDITERKKLFDSIKQNAERENFLRKISDLIKTYNNDESLYYICKELNEFLDVQSVKIHLFDLEQNDIKYLKGYSTDVETLKNNFNNDVKSFLLKSVRLLNDYVVVSNVEKFGLNIEIKKYLLLKNIKSVIWTSTQERNNLYYGMVIFDNKIRNWTDEEIDLVKMTSEYVGKVIMNATLYSQSLFVSNVLHELKNPLTVINTFAEAIINRDKEKSELTKNFIEKIKNNANKLNSIIDNMLFVSALGEVSLPSHKIDLSSVVYESIEFVKEFSDSKNIRITTKISKQVSINANKDIFMQVIVNLLNNAIKYSRDNSEIRVTIEKTKEEISISVRDEGYGIDEKHIDKIFEPFYRIDNSRSRSTGGTGLGLYIVKTIVQKLGGRISCISSVNKHTNFIIHLPIVE